MNAVVKAEEQPQLPAPVVRRGISEAQWLTLMNNLYPGASGPSVIMVWDYCAARKLDPLKKPCHIVPMKVKNQAGDYVWRDVVMAGIYEYRTTATRTGQYLGHTIPVYGEIVEYAGVMAPATCSMTVKRWNPDAKMVAEYPVELLFAEVVGTKDGKANQRWAKAPRQMLTKCVEAAALREAFPDELGGTHTADEMEGQNQDAIDITPGRIDPRGDVSAVDWELRDKHVSAITDILNADKEEADIAGMLAEYEREELQPFPELYMTVFDKLASDGIITKANFKKYIAKASSHQRPDGRP